jgi:hypothetical protein
VPDGVDEDAKAVAREQCDGSWSCPAAAHVLGCFASAPERRRAGH